MARGADKQQQIPDQPWRVPVDEVLTQLDVESQQGLVPGEARRRARHYGPNRLRQGRGRSGWRILLDQLKSVVIILLLIAAGAALLFDHVLESIAIAAAVVVNTVIGFAMEWRATRAMEALQRMAKSRARVRRDAKDKQIDAEQLVPGDIVLLEGGDMIPADLRLIETNRLQVDESALTGESQAVDKQSDALAESEVALAERANMAFKGAAITQGSGAGVVINTGMDTELGHVAHLAEQAEQAATPLEQRLDALGRRLVWLTLVVAAVVAAAGLFAGKPLWVMLETALALAIAAVPEGLPVVATLALAQGMRRMARRNAVIKRLSAVETLGATSVIFSDKTGTLTENHMMLTRLALNQGTVSVDSNDETRFTRDDEPLDPDDAPALRAALEVGAMCNNASVEDRQSVGDPTEVALLEAAHGADIQRKALLEQMPETREVSFDPQVKMMATFHRLDEAYRVAVKGAPEAVIDKCSTVLNAEGDREELDDKAREQWHRQADKLAGEGLRVLVLAGKQVDDEQAEPYADLTLLALAGLHDPPREGIEEAVGACQAAGIRVIMGTGDHGATARAIAAQIGLADADATVMTAEDIRDLDDLDEQGRRDILDCRIFARISPKQKLDLIDLYQDNEQVVGMTGDGVNDAPALKKADIGIAMGRRGTEVAREAADMVLKDDAFATIVVAIEHGRTIFQNIRRFIVYLLSGNLGEIMAISAAAVVAAPLPMLPLQILYINFVSDVLPALALGLSRAQGGVMQRAPRDIHEPILLRSHWLAIVAYGALIAATVLAVFAIALLQLQLPTAQAVTIGFLTFGFARLWHVFNMRSTASPLFVNEVSTNRFVWVSLLVGIGLMAGAVYLSPLAQVLATTVPDATQWALILSFSLFPLLVGQVSKLIMAKAK